MALGTAAAAVAAVSMVESVVESAVSDRSRRERAWACMRWQPGLGLVMRLGIKGVEGRAVVRWMRRVVRGRRRVGACMVDLRVAGGVDGGSGLLIGDVWVAWGGMRVIEGKRWKGKQ